MQFLSDYRNDFEAYLNEQIQLQEPEGLYAPIKYIMNLGGKRMRPVAALLAAEICGGTRQEAMAAALAVEVFHNFSLVHDDIMDDAPLRRGQETVHEKWDINTGILSGDAMLIRAYTLVECYPAEKFKDLVSLFSTTAMEVCEGQQYDVDFEERDDVTVAEYLHMIRCKTAVLLAGSLKMGAITAGASQKQQNLLYDFGVQVGMAFQLQDDYLDVYGNPETFGKQPGGDIIENKKTYLYLKCLEQLPQNQAWELAQLYTLKPKDPAPKIETVTQWMSQSGAAEATKAEMQAYTEKAFALLDELDGETEKIGLLRQMAEGLLVREF
ncbi:polyprenyl synthetase family protein [Sediminicola luteus]|uniref:Polyprenyl synthetase n=1 Tax=Sediminicola luteus TaxID=319238 RepID=A0A2A4GGA6_9FLAO|nr:polyprenyl synthetase family protein [Sediminicola luteus]PCE66772.1 polyprenyl synthetase [Sediminicola luteus]